MRASAHARPSRLVLIARAGGTRPTAFATGAGARASPTHCVAHRPRHAPPACDVRRSSLRVAPSHPGWCACRRKGSRISLQFNINPFWCCCRCLQMIVRFLLHAADQERADEGVALCVYAFFAILLGLVCV
jgi:hypothetical protein